MRALLTILSITLLLSIACSANVSLNDDEVNRIKDLLNKNATAKALYNGFKSYADKSLSQQPQPIAVYQSAGLLQGDPTKTKSAKAAEDYHKMYCLAWAYKVSGDVKYLNKLSEFLAAWAKINKSNGNPVDDRLMAEVIEGFDLVQKDLHTNITTPVIAWLRQFADKEMYHSQVTPGPGTGTNNWNSNRLLIVGYIGVALNDSKIIDWTATTLEAFLPTTIYADGTSFDFKQRDALHYHVFNLQPLIKLAIALKRHGNKNYYTYVATNGASIEKSINWLKPYITGEKTHAEYVHSTVPFDKQRADNGEGGYTIGHVWNPEESAQATAPACYFKPDLLPLVQKALNHTVSFPTWDNVLDFIMLTNTVVSPAPSKGK